MIYLISEETDTVTDNVEIWLLHNKVNYKRINDNFFYNLSLNFDTNFLNDASIVWHRRGKYNFLPTNILYAYPNRDAFVKYMDKEAETIVYYVESNLKKRLKDNYIGSYLNEISNNKLVNLKIAQKVGFLIPKTVITNNKIALKKFIEKFDKVITKDLRTPVYIRTKDKVYTSTGVKIVDGKMVNKLNKTFAPIFLQQYIEKQIELRVYVFRQKIYTMAIFSQNDKKTSIDFRNYNNERPNRAVPYKLPKQIEDKVKSFMKELNYRTGSIDLILTPQNEYVFLEINPMGQFHWLSENCNYYIEKEIAKTLANA